MLWHVFVPNKDHSVFQYQFGRPNFGQNSVDYFELPFIYHTGDEKAIIGISTIIKECYPEPNALDWVAVDLAPEMALKNPVTLARIKQDKSLQKMVLVRAARLSVQPVTKEEFDHILELSSKP